MYVGTSQFAGQLRYLRSHGYHPVTMQQVWDDWTGKADLPRRPVVLSFDDGYPDQYSNAARQLRRYHWPAVLNLVVHRGTALSNSQVRRMVKWGWEIGSHTLGHPSLTRCSTATLRHELVMSRRILRKQFDVPVDFLCYPGGAYDGRVMRAARDAGYLGGDLDPLRGGDAARALCHAAHRRVLGRVAVDVRQQDASGGGPGPLRDRAPTGSGRALPCLDAPCRATMLSRWSLRRRMMRRVVAASRVSWRSSWRARSWSRRPKPRVPRPISVDRTSSPHGDATHPTHRSRHCLPR